MKTRVLPWAALVCGLLLLTYGLLRGEGEVVWSKAVNICLECIGIG